MHNLHKWGIKDETGHIYDATCTLCSNGSIEDYEHMFFKCERLCNFWELVNTYIPLPNIKIPFQEVLFGKIDHLITAKDQKNRTLLWLNGQSLKLGSGIEKTHTCA